MNRADEYRRRAEEADRAAAKAPGPVERETFEKIARSWRDFESTARLSEKRGL